MKNILKTGWVIMVLGTVVSCTDLEETVYDQLTTDNFFKTQEDVVAAFAPAYSGYRSLVSNHQGSWYWLALNTVDETVTPVRGSAWFDGGIHTRLYLHDWTNDENTIRQTWRQMYNGVNTCNRLIYQFENAEFEVPDLDAVIAELKVARAFWYYLLIDYFGNVPIVTEFDLPEGFLPETSSRAEVFDFIVTELRENMDLLSNEVNADTYGRWNRWNARHLLARMYLNAEVWSGEPMWEECKTLCEEIMGADKYHLEANYKAPFMADNENSGEITFAIPFDEVYTAGNNRFHVHMWTLHGLSRETFNAQTGFWGGISATPSFISSYDPDDLRIADSWLSGPQYASDGTPLYCAGWRSEDAGKPLDYTREIDDLTDAGEHQGYRLFKYEIEDGVMAAMNNDFVFFRYADIYFMLAECLYRQGDAESATVLINEVRSRAFETPEPLTAGMLDDDRFLDEYAWEFCQEGHRRQQLIRFGQFTTKAWSFHSPSESFRTLFPIPREEMLANPNLKPNPGYN
ncbi:RagB/SusD family nutrient uptake outer membrane protein [Sinomicrobium soli]|uniref:RagB/SusD family nutrient uptake outer membrane protein n=1 Tax=Sinomicrobium sp. N-1-3-6 TaxID=2219864 RepID=UPI000DCC6F6E|nr:RagB/SusD family nutrient uptake outer membrane protein [Sinomicrobium sp. N-1-3-6]RAV28212.1 RagB/SusD family nutrient uptake outer membrane protein [Sinomicrobium sp. N-1-3-6]